MCKYLIKFDIDSKVGCNDCMGVQEEVKNKAVLFTIITLLLAVAAGGLGFSIYSILTNAWQFYNQKQIGFEIILAICGAGLLFLFFFLATYTLVGEFFIKTEYKIGKIKRLAEISTKSSNQVLPQ